MKKRGPSNGGLFFFGLGCILTGVLVLVVAYELSIIK